MHENDRENTTAEEVGEDVKKMYDTKIYVTDRSIKKKR